MYIEETKKGEFEKMIEKWKQLNKSFAKDNIVKYKDHFYEGKSTGLNLLKFIML
jgi:hypothetical protein